MFSKPFEHYISYGSTDQQTVLDIRDRIDGLLIPGTVAAFQKDGTGGFVLSLSANAKKPYVIDPRFPLFQQQLASPKKSHEALANDIFGVPDLVSKAEPPDVAKFTDEVIDGIAKRWVDFNLKYKDERSSKFEKYAKRLNEDVPKENADGPSHVLAPYFMAEGAADPWWPVSTKLYERTAAHAGNKVASIRVIASQTPPGLAQLIDNCGQQRIVVWVNALDERYSAPQTLTAYMKSLQIAKKKGVATFALYGGFFSVLCSAVGLGGCSHGVGYGENREYLELPESGRPPARYYLPLLHRFVSHELAIRLWQANPALVQCACKICDAQSIAQFDYHSLMKHSVLCRSNEIDHWVGMNLKDAVKKLQSEYVTYTKLLRGSTTASELLKSEGLAAATHIDFWVSAIQGFDAK